MKIVFKSICCLFFISILLCTKSGKADSDFDLWKKNFYKEALKSGISQQLLDDIVPKMTLLERVIQQDTAKPEFMLNFYDHIAQRTTPDRIATGKKLSQKYKTWLSKIEQKYDIPSAYLLALWGMETNYGGYMGNVEMRDSLASLAYHPRRRKFFTQELIAYLKILESENSVAPIKGSWDGGFGHFQFMPTTFWAYAVDEDQNGRRDLVHNIPDSLGSAANYLHRIGWKADIPWGREVILADSFDWAKTKHTDKKTVAEWSQSGILPKGLADFPESEHSVLAEFYAPMGQKGPTYLIYPNFKLITRWNALWLNAIATCLLADSIQGKDDLPQKPQDFVPLKTSAVICLQNKLHNRGYHINGADGKIGQKTKTAIQEFQQKNGLIPDGYPNQILFKLLECQND